MQARTINLPNAVDTFLPPIDQPKGLIMKLV
jgi:hypothetical protein